jgi:hypothetical protein
MHSAAKQNVMEHYVIQWIHAMLSNQQTVTAQTGSMIRVFVSQSVRRSPVSLCGA